MNARIHSDYFYFSYRTITPPLSRISFQRPKQIFQTFSLNENQSSLLLFCDATNNALPQHLSQLWNYILVKSYKMLRQTGLHVDFKDTFESLLFGLTTKIGAVDPISIFLVKFLTFQFQLIKNKRMQLVWLKRLTTQLTLCLKFNALTQIHNQNLIMCEGLNMTLCGRAADLRWVKPRYFKTGAISKTSKRNIGEWIARDEFVTKWGSISLSVKSRPRFIK